MSGVSCIKTTNLFNISIKHYKIHVWTVFLPSFTFTAAIFPLGHYWLIQPRDVPKWRTGVVQTLIWRVSPEDLCEMTTAIARSTRQTTFPRIFASKYSIFASACAIVLFLGAIICMQTCHMCPDTDTNGAVAGQRLCPPGPKSDSSSSWAHLGKRWMDRMMAVSSREDPANNLNAYLVIVIISSCGNMERRDAIRQTWLKEPQSDVLHLFAIGSGTLQPDEKMTLESENTRFRDILFLPNVNDSYESLTEKLLWSLAWVHDNVRFKFLFKADDDTFARVDDMVAELTALEDPNRLYWGYFDGRARVKRKGRWAERDWVLCDLYLPYALGGGYVLSADLVQYVATNRGFLKRYASEDVSMGTWLAPVAVRRVHDVRFDTEYRSRGCSNGYLVTHKQSAAQMRQKFWSLQERNQMCAVEYRDRGSYVYDWKGPPSKCCARNDSASHR